MDLAELIYQALRRHLGKEKEEEALRATAQKIAALWSKQTQSPGGTGSMAQVEQPRRDRDRGEEVMERRDDVTAPSETEMGRTEGIEKEESRWIR